MEEGGAEKEGRRSQQKEGAAGRAQEGRGRSDMVQ